MAFDARLFSGIGMFVTVVETGNFTRAAIALGLTGSGVSRAISRLELRLGIRLFERSPRAVALTPEGKRFYQRVLPLMDEAENAAADAGGENTVITGRLRVAADPPSAHNVIAPMLPCFSSTYPLLTVEVVVRDTMSDLVSDGFDAVVRFGDIDARGLRAQYLGASRVLTVASPSFLKQYGRPEKLADLDKFNCIAMRDPNTLAAYPWKFIDTDDTFTIKPRANMLINDGITLRNACKNGGGIAQLLDIEIKKELNENALVEIFPHFREEKYPLNIYTLPGVIKSRRAEIFAESLQEYCSALQRLGRFHN